MESNPSRRAVLLNATTMSLATTASLLGATLLFPDAAEAADKEPEVTATENSMREHGVIRRALLVYFETVPKLRVFAATLKLPRFSSSM
jgi:hypothetical protein